MPSHKNKRQRRRAERNERDRQLALRQQQANPDSVRRPQQRPSQWPFQGVRRHHQDHLDAIRRLREQTWQPGVWIDLETGVVEPCEFRWIDDSLWIRFFILRPTLVRREWTEQLQPEWSWRERSRHRQWPEIEQQQTERTTWRVVFYVLVLALVAVYLRIYGVI